MFEFALIVFILAIGLAILIFTLMVLSKFWYLVLAGVFILVLYYLISKSKNKKNLQQIDELKNRIDELKSKTDTQTNTIKELEADNKQLLREKERADRIIARLPETLTNHDDQLSNPKNHSKQSTKADNPKKILKKLKAPKNSKRHNPEILNLIYSTLSENKDDTGNDLNQLVQIIFERLGYTSLNNDGVYDQGADILIFSKDDESYPNFVIQCKSQSPQTNTQRLDIKEVASFKGRSNYDKAELVYITTNFLTVPALEELSDKMIIIDRIGFLKLLTKVFPNETAHVINSFSFRNDIDYPKFKELVEAFNKLGEEQIDQSPYKLHLGYAQNCKNCKHGKLQKLYSKDKKVFYHKCTTCLSVYYPQKYNDYNLKYARTDNI